LAPFRTSCAPPLTPFRAFFAPFLTTLRARLRSGCRAGLGSRAGLLGFSIRQR
jgi:hypothetical protein